ncbi:hypothetical protein [Photobacterium minamisatsumaniensis]|uniref:hypothetical protein n=1 Tax=Photobacterium minamisatsumaniensis TaxID=2910233 RepID=UPI003D09F832
MTFNTWHFQSELAFVFMGQGFGFGAGNFTRALYAIVSYGLGVIAAGCFVVSMWVAMQ